MKWLINLRSNLILLKALKKCMKTYEKLDKKANSEGNQKLALFYNQQFLDTASDYYTLRQKMLGWFANIF
jgi:hypothetical protein